MKKQQEIVLWLLLAGLVLFLGRCLPELSAESKEETKWSKPVKLATAWKLQCKSQKWIVLPEGQIFYTIAGMVKFTDQPNWYGYLKTYDQVEKPTTFKEDCWDWMSFVRHEYIKEIYVIHVESH